MNIDNLFNLSDRVAIVTGAARGIGRDICLKLAEQGADIVAVDLLEDELTHRLAAPEWDDRLFVDITNLRAHGERYLVSGSEVVQVFQTVTADLRVRRRRLGDRALLADDQLSVADMDSLVFHEVVEGQSAAHRRRNRSQVLSAERSHQLSPLRRDGGYCLQASLP